jgi:hypothetical protein
MAIQSKIPLTRHATARVRQRGIPVRLLDLVVAYADRELHAGNGCTTLGLSRRAAAGLVADGVATSDEVARAVRVAALVGRRGVVSVLRPARGSRGRVYRRQGDTRATQGGR